MIKKPRKTRSDKGKSRQHRIKFKDLAKYKDCYVIAGPTKALCKLVKVADDFLLLSDDYDGWEIGAFISCFTYGKEIGHVNQEGFTKGWWLTEEGYKECGGIWPTKEVPVLETESHSSDDKDVITFLKEITDILKAISDRI